VIPAGRQSYRLESRGIPARPWLLLGLVTVPLAVGALVIWYGTQGAIVFGDIDWYATALPRLFSGGPLYDPAMLQAHVLHRPAYWNQAPSTALLSLVLLLPGGAWLWGLLMVAGVLVGIGLMWPRVGLGGAVLLAPVLLTWRPVIEAMAWANVNGLVFGLLAIAWRFPRAAGWAIGIASVIKLIPILAVAWLIGKRDWRNAALAIGLFVGATLVVVAWKGPATLSDFIILRGNEYAPADAGPGVGFTEFLGIAPLWGYLAAGLLTILAFRFASYSLAIVAMLVSVATFHLHYWTWILVPVLGAWLPWIISRLPDSSRTPSGAQPPYASATS
jgi:alpha-1,2-mannosyltransferase